MMQLSLPWMGNKQNNFVDGHMNREDDLKKQVLNSLEALIDDPVRLKKEFVSLVKDIIDQYHSTIPPKQIPALFDLIYADMQNVIKDLKNKDISKKHHKEVLGLIFLLFATYPFPPNRTERLRILAQDCDKEIAQQNKPRQNTAKRK
jgi:hypothetical protein